MIDKLTATVSWGPRPESPLECARRLTASLEAIPEQLDVYSRWYLDPPNASSPRGLLEVPPNLDDLAAWIETAAMTNDRGERMPSGGFTARLARLHEDLPVRYSARCGVDSGNLTNHVLLEFPKLDASPDVFESSALGAAFTGLVTSWEPTWGSVATRSLRDKQRAATGPGTIVVGWRTYLSNKIELDRSALPEAASVENAHAGVVITLTGGPLHTDAGQAVQVRKALQF